MSDQIWIFEDNIFLVKDLIIYMINININD